MNQHRATTLVAAGAGLLLMLGLIVAVPLLLTGDEDDCPASTPTGFDVATPVNDTPAGRVGRWEGTQLRNAAAVISAGAALGVPARAQALAVMTAMGESSLQVVDHGDHAGPDSRGLFQQRANGAWGSYTDRMDPTISATNFYRTLLRVPGWEQLPPTLAAHRTQRNADPNYYTQFWDDALHVTQTLTGSADAGLLESTYGPPTDCGAVFMAAAGGLVAYPLPAGSRYTDRRNWGHAGGRWARGHTGTDLSVACGTPVLAATAGRVEIDTGAAWSGRWLVKVATGTGQLTTWYAHMQDLAVDDGQVVQAGQQLGQVGSEGNSTGCHLHFEVHPRGGGIYADHINPTDWLAAHVGKPLPGSDIRLAAAQPPADVDGPTATPGSPTVAGGGFRLASFNVLGHSHTNHGGKNAALASGPTRMRGTLRLLAAYRIDVAGLQELQKPQWAALRSSAGDVYDIHPASTRTHISVENSIIWRRDTFRLLRTGSVAIPYFNGRIKPMPVVLLEQRATGRTAWFANVHNPADTHRFPRQGRWRAEAVRRERRLLVNLAATGRPVFLTGDFNSRTDAYCQLTAGGLARASVGGQTTPTCRPNAKSIDWIFAAGNAGFTGHRLDPNPRRSGISDHPIVVSNALIGR